MKNRKTVRILLAALFCCLLFGVFALSAVAGEPETHAVSFWLDDGVPYQGQDQEVADGGYAVVPLTPEKENAVFRRWTLENGEAVFADSRLARMYKYCLAGIDADGATVRWRRDFSPVD